jgi:general secretion pathway protein G
VGLLASVAVPLAELAAQRTKESELHAALRELRSGIDAYKAAAEQGHIVLEVDASGYPPDLDVLVNGVEDARDPNKAMMYFLRRIPRDPLFPDTTAPAASTWGLRSYKSPPDDPQPGEDVFDIYSLSTRKGINGVPYREW